MMMREDVLRELELLPLWTLRSPPSSLLSVATAATLAAVSPAEQHAVEVVPSAALVEERLSAVEVATEPSVVDALDVAPMPPQLLQHMHSDDGDCMFVFAAAELQADEATLLRNMIMAMAIKSKAMAAPAYTAELVATQPPKLLIVLGETAAQYLLQTTLPLADLRGSVHSYQEVALVVSYDLAHLLQTLPDKAQAWADLCLALHTLQRLKSTD
jgi:DNA polymerase